MSQRRVPLLLPLIALWIAGCTGGPVATSGTQGLAKEQLATIHVIKHGAVHEWNGHAVHIESFSVGGVQYLVPDETRDFLISPGEHTFRVDYAACVHGISAVPNLEDDGIYTPPYGEFKSRVDPGGYYTLVGEPKLTGGNGIQLEHHLAPTTRPTSQSH